MSPDRLPAVRLRPLSLRSLRSTFGAPELERLLALRDVDLAAMDQVQALEVRVRRGLEVVADRGRATSRAARRLRARWLVAMTLAILAAAGTALYSTLLEEWIPAAAVGFPSAFLAALAATFVHRLSGDVKILSALENRYDEAVGRTEGMQELMHLSRAIFAEVNRVAGGIGEGQGAGSRM